MDLLLFEGPELEHKLRNLGIVLGEPYSSTWRMDLDAFEAHVSKYAVIIEGDLVKET